MKTIPEIVKEVEDNIIGRVANKIGNERTNGVEILLEYVWKAGGGNHLEIGTLFGGSAIAVALLKKYHNQNGMVFCIDPLDGYYGNENDISGVPVNPYSLFRNIRKFKVGDRIAVIRAYSQDVDLYGIKFTTAYIDGCHKDGIPVKDWNMCKNLVSKYVVFDNFSDNLPDVQIACGKASTAPNWEFEFLDSITYVVKRK